MKFDYLKKINMKWLVLAFALSTGLIAAFIAKNYLNSEMDAIKAEVDSGRMSVVVPKLNMAEGETISEDKVAVRQFPVNYVPVNAIIPEEFDRAAGRVLSNPANSGDMLMWSQLEKPKPPTFSAKLIPGRRAITVAVDDISSISGLLEPGDNIDLIVSLTQKDKKITAPLLQMVQVMATGQRTDNDPKSGEKRVFNTVTLNLTPKQAQSVIVARESGRLTAMLRSPQDKFVEAKAELDVATLVADPAPAKPVKPVVKKPNELEIMVERTDKPKDIVVPVLYGGKAENAHEGLNMKTYYENAVRNGSLLPPPPLSTRFNAAKNVSNNAPADAANDANSEPVPVLTSPTKTQ